MAIKQLIQQQSIPDFELPDKYLSDIWNIKEWDYYKAKDRRLKTAWNMRSSITGGNFNLESCKNSVIKEEIKYCFYYMIEIKCVCLSTFAEKYDYLKHVIRYINTTNYSSLTEITDTSEFARYIIFTVENKAETNNGKRIEVSSMTYIPTKKKNRCITFLETCIQTVLDYYQKDIPEKEKDVWHCKNMPIENLKTSGKLLDFRAIKNEEFKQQLKDFCFNRLSSICWDSTYSYLMYLKKFFSWLKDNYPEIIHLIQLNREIIEDYFCWLRIENDATQHVTNTAILDLKVFFEYGILLGFENFPQKALITTRDYAFKTKKESTYLTDEEVSNVMAAVLLLKNKMYGRMLYILLMTGMRISELLELSVDALRQYPDGKYYLCLFQFKTLDEYEKPIDDNVAKIIQKEIITNRKKHGDSLNYVFVDTKNKPIAYTTFCENINKMLVDNEVKDKNGLPIKFHMHRMRSTYATNLFKSGEDPQGTANLMGQRCLRSLAHYVVIKNPEVKRQLKPRIDKDEMLINNIGHIDNAILSDYEHAEPLCNGWCVRNSSMGACLKANSCLNCNLFVPTEKHLASYKLQLLQIESSITIAETNQLDAMLEKNLQTKQNLENIIAKLEKKMEEKKND